MQYILSTSLIYNKETRILLFEQWNSFVAQGFQKFERRNLNIPPPSPSRIEELGRELEAYTVSYLWDCYSTARISSCIRRGPRETGGSLHTREKRRYIGQTVGFPLVRIHGLQKQTFLKQEEYIKQYAPGIWPYSLSTLNFVVLSVLRADTFCGLRSRELQTVMRWQNQETFSRRWYRAISRNKSVDHWYVNQSMLCACVSKECLYKTWLPFWYRKYTRFHRSKVL